MPVSATWLLKCKWSVSPTSIWSASLPWEQKSNAQASEWRGLIEPHAAACRRRGGDEAALERLASGARDHVVAAVAVAARTEQSDRS